MISKYHKEHVAKFLNRVKYVVVENHLTESQLFDVLKQLIVEDTHLRSLITGPKGKDGDIGPCGPIGEQGPPGDSVTVDDIRDEVITQLKDDLKFLKSIKGEKGDPGENYNPGWAAYGGGLNDSGAIEIAKTYAKDGTFDNNETDLSATTINSSIKEIANRNTIFRFSI